MKPARRNSFGGRLAGDGRRHRTKFWNSSPSCSARPPSARCSCRRSPTTRATRMNARSRQLLTREPDRVIRFVGKHDRYRRGMFFCTSTLEEGPSTRNKETVRETPSLFADLDFKDLVETSRTIRARMLATCGVSRASWCAPAAGFIYIGCSPKARHPSVSGADRGALRGWPGCSAATPRSAKSRG